MYTKPDFFRPARPYNGPHNPEAYARGIERRKTQNAAMAQANRAEAARATWMTPARATLMADVGNEAAKGNTFAQSLCDAFQKWGTLTERQEAAAQRFRPEIAEQSKAAWRASQPTVAGDLAPMLALFEKAAQKLKKPGFTFNLVDGGRNIRVTQCGPRTNAPGALNVKDADTGEYVGRIHLDGKWIAAREFRSDTAVQAALTAFSADPAGVAAAYGKRTGCCMFCGKGLTDERSTAVGYGPVCASNFGLAWG